MTITTFNKLRRRRLTWITPCKRSLARGMEENMKTMKTFLVIAAFFAASINLFAQNFTKPDYEQIKLNIENNQSNFYYPNLWDRFQQGDSTMTLEEKRHLYYGYVFHKNYSPYLTSHDAVQVKAILEKDNPTNEDWNKLITLLNTSLIAEPFNLRFFYYQSVAYNEINNFVDADKNLRKIFCIADALTSSGDGLSKETAIHVISVSSEYDYLFLMDLSMKSQSLMDGYYDVLTLEPNKYDCKKLWFDVSQPLNHIQKSFK